MDGPVDGEMAFDEGLLEQGRGGQWWRRTRSGVKALEGPREEYTVHEKKTPCQPRQPTPRVGVFGGWEISNPHLCPQQPVPVTRAGWPTCKDPFPCAWTRYLLITY